MKALLIYPKYPDTFWGFKYALKFVFKRAAHPPLGLLTVASLLPMDWQIKLLDLNVKDLKEKDIKGADIVLISAISIQKESVKDIVLRCKKYGVKIVAGGPLFTTNYEEFEEIDYFVLKEAEVTLPLFLKDFKDGKPKHIYKSSKWADIRSTPVPKWELIDMKKYASLSIQYSRGCPFNCEFCDISLLCGRIPRVKSKEQIILELESLNSLGWRGTVFFVDDNFIGNKLSLKKEILPALIDWMEEKKYPFSFLTQASINLADDEELMKLMAKAGFDTVFIGIETPDEESLTECSKLHNKNRDLVNCINKIQRFGLEVRAGFIVGFDNDNSSIFDRQINFIQKSGIVTAMVSLLNALRGTKLYNRLKKENRILKDSSGDNTDFTINFIPKMDYKTLMNGYKKIISTIYSPKYYYKRVMTFLKEYIPAQKKVFKFRLSHLFAFLKSIFL